MYVFVLLNYIARRECGPIINKIIIKYFVLKLPSYLTLLICVIM